jgi:flagellar hook protein FlgE
MSSILNIAVSGLTDASKRIANATSNIVNAQSTNFQPQDVITLSNSVAGNNLGVSTTFVPAPFNPPLAPTPAPVPSLAPVATSQVDIAANLPSSAADGFTSSPVTVQVYDNLGATHDVSLTFTKTATDAWSVNVSAPGGATSGTPPVAGDYNARVPVTFNSAVNTGTLSTITSGAGYSVANAQVLVALSYPGAGTQNVKLSFGKLNAGSGLTQFADSNVTVSDLTPNGSAYSAAAAAAVTTGSTVPAAVDNGVDLASNLVAIDVASSNYGANAAVIKVAQKLEKALIDIKT